MGILLGCTYPLLFYFYKKVQNLKKISVMIYLLFIVISIILFVNSFSIPNPEVIQNRFGPQLYPQIILIGIIVLVSFLLYREIEINNKKESEVKEIYKNKNRFFQTIFISLIFAFLFSWLGGILSIFIFTLAFIWIWRIRKPFNLIFFPILVTLGIYIIFHVLLSVRFPKGFIGNFF